MQFHLANVLILLNFEKKNILPLVDVKTHHAQSHH